ncbi:MAG: ATP-grasp domain-containing protein [Eubacteriales bacterium]
MSKIRILVYPCGTEIGLEIYKAACRSVHYELIGGSSSYDHGRFAFKSHIDYLPFITDESGPDAIESFVWQIRDYHIDMIYPAMDGIVYKFAQYRNLFDCKIIAPDFETACVTRSKLLTYEKLGKIVPVPRLYDENDDNLKFPLFLKPDVGQGSVGASKVTNRQELDYLLAGSAGKKMLLMDYLPGEELTVDCFTNGKGVLVYAGIRRRKRIKSGISVNAVAVQDEDVTQMAHAINSAIRQKGGWFFQVKQKEDGQYVLMEVASRVAGASSFTRSLGVNLPLLTMHLFNGNDIDSVMCNQYELELDRALTNSYKIDIRYSHVYVDYDDTVVIDDQVNLQLVAFLYQCVNEGIPITLLSKHAIDLFGDLKKRRLETLFDDVCLLERQDEKYRHIKEADAIFIDDSYGERREVFEKLHINVFDTHMVECLMKE